MKKQTFVLLQTDDTAEREILAIQKELQNLPDLDSPSYVLARPRDPAGFSTVPAEFEPVARQRSRSMPRDDYGPTRYLTLPDSFPFNGRLPRGRSAGTLGFQVNDNNTVLHAHICTLVTSFKKFNSQVGMLLLTYISNLSGCDFDP